MYCDVCTSRWGYVGQLRHLSHIGDDVGSVIEEWQKEPNLRYFLEDYMYLRYVDT